jgi:hypothetical protein
MISQRITAVHCSKMEKNNPPPMMAGTTERINIPTTQGQFIFYPPKLAIDDG